MGELRSRFISGTAGQALGLDIRDGPSRAPHLDNLTGLRKGRQSRPTVLRTLLSERGSLDPSHK